MKLTKKVYRMRVRKKAAAVAVVTKLVREEVESLKCILTQAEVLEAGKRLADKSGDLMALQEDKKRVTSDFGAKITAVQAEINLLSDKVRSGYEFRPVKVRVTFDEPKTGKKTLVRMDSGEVLGVEEMTETEMQRQFDFAEECKAKDGHTSTEENK